MKLNELVEGSFDGMTGGEDKNPLKLKKKITVKPIGNMTGSLFSDDEKFFIPLDKKGSWYLHDDGNPHFGATSENSTGYFKTRADAEHVLSAFI